MRPFLPEQLIIPAAGCTCSLTGDLSLRSGAGAVALLRVHPAGVGTAPARSRRGAPAPCQGCDRAEQRQQRVPGERWPGFHPHQWKQEGGL